MTNTNCLENIKCPDCGYEESFRIAASTIFTVTDDGTEDYGDVEWNDDSYAECLQCLRQGKVKDFSCHDSASNPSPVTGAIDLTVRFDAYEIHGVGEFDDGTGKYCEQVPDDAAEFWSLYGHIPGQGVDCIGDFKTRKHAEEIYARITGRRYGDPRRGQYYARFRPDEIIICTPDGRPIAYLQFCDDPDEECRPIADKHKADAGLIVAALNAYRPKSAKKKAG